MSSNSVQIVHQIHREFRNVSSILRQLFPEFSEQYEMCPQAVDMWTTAKRRSCPHTHSDDDDVMLRHHFVAAG